MVTSCCGVYKDSMCPVWPEVSMDDRIKKGKHGRFEIDSDNGRQSDHVSATRLQSRNLSRC